MKNKNKSIQIVKKVLSRRPSDQTERSRRGAVAQIAAANHFAATDIFLCLTSSALAPPVCQVKQLTDCSANRLWQRRDGKRFFSFHTRFTSGGTRTASVDLTRLLFAFCRQISGDFEGEHPDVQQRLMGHPSRCVFLKRAVSSPLLEAWCH